MPTKLPFKLNTLAADRHFIPVFPDNKQWLIVLKGTELGDKLCSLLQQSDKNENVYGLWFDKIHGLYQEERQLLEEQVESYYNEKLTFQKHIAVVAKALDVDNDKAIELLDDPYKDGVEKGEKVEPFLDNFRELALNLTKLESRLNEDAIAVVIRKRLAVEWSKEETEMLHEGMIEALSNFISNEQKGWKDNSLLPSASEHLPSEDEGNDTENQTGLPSTTTSKAGQTTPDSTT